jgi:hypothetical protein
MPIVVVPALDALVRPTDPPRRYNSSTEIDTTITRQSAIILYQYG